MIPWCSPGNLKGGSLLEVDYQENTKGIDMTREEAKERMLKAFLDNIMYGETLTSFVAGFGDDFEPFDGELYNMMRELVSEGKLCMFKFNITEEHQYESGIYPVEFLFPPGTTLV